MPSKALIRSPKLSFAWPTGYTTHATGYIKPTTPKPYQPIPSTPKPDQPIPTEKPGEYWAGLIYKCNAFCPGFPVIQQAGPRMNLILFQFCLHQLFLRPKRETLAFVRPPLSGCSIHTGQLNQFINLLSSIFLIFHYRMVQEGTTWRMLATLRRAG